MIEVRRNALTAEAIALPTEFFSFGTNDLTLVAVDVSPRHLIPTNVSAD